MCVLEDTSCGISSVLAYLVYQSVSQDLSELEVPICDHHVYQVNQLHLGLLGQGLSVVNVKESKQWLGRRKGQNAAISLACSRPISLFPS